MSGMQGNQGCPAIRVVLCEDVSKKLSFLTVRGDRPSVPLASVSFGSQSLLVSNIAVVCAMSALDGAPQNSSEQHPVGH